MLKELTTIKKVILTLFLIWIAVTIASVRYAVYMQEFYNGLANFKLDFHVLGSQYHALFYLAFFQISMLGVWIIASWVFSCKPYPLFVVWLIDMAITLSLLFVGLYVQINMTHILEINLKQIIDIFYKNLDAAMLLILIQTGYNCCGSTSYQDWLSPGQKKLPISCCHFSKNCTIDSIDLQESGCAKYMNKELESEYAVVVWLSIPIIILKILMTIVVVIWKRNNDKVNNIRIQYTPNNVNEYSD